MNRVSYSIILVTYDSELFLPKCIESIDQQSFLPNKIIIVDTGSKNIEYLQAYIQRSDVIFVQAKAESGFCIGNNIAFRCLPKDSDYFLLLNPDAFLFSDSMKIAIDFMENKENKSFGMLTGILYGYDIKTNQAKEKYDSTGIFSTWYGKWYDRGQGENIDETQYNKIEEVPAICGAFMFCRKKAIDEILIPFLNIFDPKFYMYKEDIDLSLRLKKKGWKIVYNPDVKAFHCRGWNNNRKEMSRKVRIFSARNELKIHLKSFSLIGTMYSTIKLFLVYFFNL